MLESLFEFLSRTLKHYYGVSKHIKLGDTWPQQQCCMSESLGVRDKGESREA